MLIVSFLGSLLNNTQSKMEYRKMHFQIKIITLLLLQTIVVVKAQTTVQSAVTTVQNAVTPIIIIHPSPDSETVRDNQLCRKLVPDTTTNPLRVDLNNHVVNKELWTKFKDCLTLKVSPLAGPSYLHISLRITNNGMIAPINGTGPPIPAPDQICTNISITQMAIQALDQDGQAVGNFKLYEKPNDYDNTPLEVLCKNEDILATYPEDSVIQRPFICVRYEKHKTDSSRYVSSSTIKYRPSLLYVKMINGDISYATKEGACFTWTVDPEEYATLTTKPLANVQFIMELLAQVKEGQFTRNYIFVVRSRKYKFEKPKGRTDAPSGSPPTCHDDGNGLATAFDTSFWKEVPIVDPFVPGYNIYLNQLAYDGCSKDLSCKVEIPIRVPKAVTNPPAVIRLPHRPSGDDYLKQLFLKSPAKIYFGCYSTKRCVYPEGSYADCVEAATCPHLMAYGGSESDSYEILEDQIVIEMYSKKSHWFAVALSQDRQMGNDFALKCLRQAKNRLKARAYASWNYKPTPDIYKNHILEEILPSSGNNKGIRLIETIQDRDSVYCKFYVSKWYKINFTTDEGEMVSTNLEKVFTEDCCIQMAWGYNVGRDAFSVATFPSKSILYLGTLASYDYSNCRELSFRNIAQHFLPNLAQRVQLKVHGIIMAVVWCFSIPILNFTASLYKKALGTKKRLGMTLYSFYHVVLSLASLGMIIVAMLICYTGKMGWQESHVEKKGPHRQLHSFHRIGGYTVLALYILSMCVGMFLKLKVFDYFKANLFIHMILSYGMQFLAGVLILQAPQIDYLALPCTMSHIVIMWMIFYYFYMMVLSYFPFWVPYLLQYDPLSQITTRAQLLASIFQDPNHVEWLNKPDVIRIKIKCLVILVVAGVLFTAALVVVIIEPPNGACYELESYAYFEYLEQLRL